MVRALSVKSPSSASANVCCAVRCMRPHGPARSVLGCRPALQVVTRAASVTVRRKFRAGPTAPCIGVPGPFRYEQDRSKFPRDGQLQGDLMHDARDLRVSFSEWARNFETQIEVLSARSSATQGQEACEMELSPGAFRPVSQHRQLYSKETGECCQTVFAVSPKLVHRGEVTVSLKHLSLQRITYNSSCTAVQSSPQRQITDLDRNVLSNS